MSQRNEMVTAANLWSLPNLLPHVCNIMDMKASCAEKVSELVLKRLNEAVRRA